jgi:hypothetical protein
MKKTCLRPQIGAKMICLRPYMIPVLFAFVSAALFAQVVAEDRFDGPDSAWKAVSGVWNTSNGKFSQTDLAAGMARADRVLALSGVMQVEFDIMYSGGGFKDAAAALQGRYHGGFGIHIGVDKPNPKRSWGNGKSYLLWLNLDTEVAERSEHFGLRAQVYDSTTSSRMNLISKLNIEVLPTREALPMLAQVPTRKVKVRLVINTDTGEVRFYDPINAGWYYFFYLDPQRLKGRFISLRTNRLGADFSGFKATRLR